MQNSTQRSTNLNHSLAYEARLNRLHRLFKTQFNVTEPSMIMEPFLFLGNCISAHDVNRLNRLGIRYVLNVAIRDVEVCPYYSRDMRTLTIDLRDDDRENILRTFDQAFAFIDEARRAKSRVLVHCSHGQSRSPAIVIAYLMRSYHVSLEQCMVHVIKARPCVIPNDGFLKQLILYDRFLVERRRQQKQEAANRERAAVRSNKATEPVEIPIQQKATEKIENNHPKNETVSESTATTVSDATDSDRSQLTSVDSSSVALTSTTSHQSASSSESVHVIPIQTSRSRKSENKQKQSITAIDSKKSIEKKNFNKEIICSNDKSGKEIISTNEKKPSTPTVANNIENNNTVSNNYIIHSEQYEIESSVIVSPQQWNLIQHYPNELFETNDHQVQTKYITEIYDRATNRFIPTTCCY